MSYEAIVIGGSYAGLSAALQLARARRRILVIDGGQRRNRFADHSHGFLSRDGESPAAIAAEARRQLLRYPTVDWQDATATSAIKTEDGFGVTTEHGGFAGRRLLLATGVTDHLPEIPGLAERWGTSIFHCPYCHGYELNQGLIGVIAVSPFSLHHALMLPDWGTTTLLLNDRFEPDAEQVSQLRTRGVRIETGAIEAISGRAEVTLTGGRELRFDGLFVMPRTEMSSPLASKLGCDFEEGPMGPFIKTSPMMTTSVDGVFACGDAARGAGSVALSVGDGAMAGAALHRTLTSQ
ncbi:MAG: NAD(P)/FAD-dependent oxidoreductase, partial [Pseudorhizobium sp.]